MSKRNRDYLELVFGPLYERHYTEEAGCFYCGQPLSCWDHCPPLHWIETTKNKYKKVLLKSCTSCNTKLGDKPLFTAYDRAVFLHDNLMAEFEKLGWEDRTWEEIEGMKRGLLKSLASRDKMKGEILSDRIRFIQQRLLNKDSFPDE